MEQIQSLSWPHVRLRVRWDKLNMIKCIPVMIYCVNWILRNELLWNFVDIQPLAFENWKCPRHGGRLSRPHWVKHFILQMKFVASWYWLHLTHSNPDNNDASKYMRRHQMKTFSALLAICAGNSPVTDEFPAQRPVTRRFDIFFDMCQNKRLSKQRWGWWFETHRAHYDTTVMNNV